MSKYLQSLNEVQRQAVINSQGPVMVIAGPGSGKTRVLTYRIAYLLEQGIPPHEILALTFTNKSAREMKERIAKVVGNVANRVWAGTFHSLFARVLRIEAEKIGFPSDFTIYDTTDSKSLLTTIIKGMNLDGKVYNVGGVRARISSAKSNIIPPKLYAENEELRTEDRHSKRPYLYKIYAEYVRRCKKAGAMDFDDLLYQLFILFYKNPDNVLEKYRSRFKYLLVDEFQDTNYLQYAIIKKLVNFEGSPRNICVVGDDAQSIYGFRGATIENILNFETDYKKFGLQTFKLEQNYRSTYHIVQAANEIITFNKNQIKKDIWSDKGKGHKIKIIKTMTDTDEGKRIVDQIREQKNRYHLQNSDIAILYRTNAQSRIFEEALNRQRIKYKVYGGMSFYERKEVKDLIAYLRMSVNPNDEEALKRVINFPKRGIGNTTQQKIIELAINTDRPLWECITEVNVGPRAKNALTEFKQMIQVFIQKQKELDAAQVTDLILRQSGMLKLLKGDLSIEGMSRMENIEALLNGIKDFVDTDVVLEEENVEEIENKSLAQYLQNIALLTDFDQDDGDDNNYITLMSTHSAKGLEFPSIFLVGLEENLFPSYMALQSDDVEEERRLFYVAITRAEQFLTLSFANSRYKFGDIRYNNPSRFLEEISELHLEKSYTSKSEKVNTVSRSGVSGNFKKAVPKTYTTNIDPSSFAPSPPASIQAGHKVLHLRFGEGKVLRVDGANDNRLATIFFQEAGEKRIALRFAKLQILK